MLSLTGTQMAIFVRMIKEKRFEKILLQLKSGNIVTYAQLAALLTVSEDTVRRDIEQLHHNGLLSKVRGGAIARHKNPLAFQDRSAYMSDEKQVIALKTQALLSSKDTIFMDGGTTICAVAEHFNINANYRVVTNNLALIPILQKFKGIDLIVLGGTYNRETQTNVGAGTCDQVTSFVADVYLMGTCAIAADTSVTASVKEDGEVKRAMLRAARNTIVLANSEKIGTWEHFKVCELEKIDTLITELASNDTKLDDFRQSKLRII